MNVRWTGVLAGFLVDFCISQIFGLLLASGDFVIAPDLTRTGDLMLIVLLTLSTGVGGYVAGRMATSHRALNGLLVGAVGVLYSQLDGAPTARVFVVASAIACVLGALGGYLARFPAPHADKLPE